MENTIKDTTELKIITDEAYKPSDIEKRNIAYGKGYK